MSATWRTFSTLTALLNRIAVLVVALLVIADLLRAGELPSIARASAFLVAHRDLALAGAALLIVLNLNVIQFVLFCFANAPSRSYIHSRTAGGTSRVAMAAVQKALESTARQVPEISRCRIRVERTGRNRYRVHIRYCVDDVIHAGSAAEHLRLVLKKRFSDLVVLDPKDRVSFDLDLQGIQPRPAAKRAKELAPPAESSYHGPVYPVDAAG